MNWKAGDKAVILKARFDKSFIGTVVTVLAIGCPAFDGEIRRMCIRVDVPPSKAIQANHPRQRYAFFTPESLGPIYDGNEITTWEDCAWQPKEFAPA